MYIVLRNEQCVHWHGKWAVCTLVWEMNNVNTGTRSEQYLHWLEKWTIFTLVWEVNNVYIVESVCRNPGRPMPVTVEGLGLIQSNEQSKFKNKVITTLPESKYWRIKKCKIAWVVDLSAWKLYLFLRVIINENIYNIILSY